MAVQLNEMKINLLNKKLSAKSFKVEMIKPKKIIEIIFQKNKEEDKYEMVIKGKNKKGIDEYINLLDVGSFLINDKDKNRVDIEYTVSIIKLFLFIQYDEKPENISIKVHELLIDYFYQTYRDFAQKANENF